MKKILVVADFPGWIFERHALEIKKRLSSKYLIDVAFHKQPIREMSVEHDLIYTLDPMPFSYPPKEKVILGLRNEFLYKQHPNGPKGLYEYGFPGRCVSIKNNCCIMHVVNKNQMDAFKDIVVDKPLLLVQHGVDEALFFDNGERALNKVFTVGISGRSNSHGKKGFELATEASRRQGFFLKTVGYNEGICLTKEQMPDFYRSLDAYCCLSETEGLNNGILEAGSVGTPLISTKSGAAEEIIQNGVNGLLIDRDLASLEAALNEMVDPRFREDMGRNIAKTIKENWTWETRIKDFEKMFDSYFSL